MALYAVRIKGVAGSLVGVTHSPDVETSEICEECYKRGIIWHVHDDTEEHKGAESFKLRYSQ